MTMEAELARLWGRIEEWLQANAPSVLHSLNPPAGVSEIGAAEAELGIRFPEDFRASLLIHNGQVVNEYDGSVPGLLDGYELLSLPRLLREHRGWGDLLKGGAFTYATAQAGPEVQKHWWHPQWVPITYNGSGDNYCIDLNPSTAGVSGQIISVLHDDPNRRVIAPSFREWLRSFADQLWAGEYTYSDDMGGIMRLEDA